MLLEHQDVITEFCSPFRWKELSKEMSSKILPCGDGSCWKMIKPISSLIEILKMLVWILGSKSVERASVFHQSDGVGSQRHHIVPFGELSGVSITLMASLE
ncbi:hypothetical protein Tco_1084556 [Tanacetum coccineum]